MLIKEMHSLAEVFHTREYLYSKCSEDQLGAKCRGNIDKQGDGCCLLGNGRIRKTSRKGMGCTRAWNRGKLQIEGKHDFFFFFL